jgi:3-deoxy-D-manno-octulosonic-acid transferase
LYLAYSLLLAAAFVVALPFYLWKGRGTGKYLPSFRERMGGPPPSLARDDAPSVWIHAVSVGEVLTARILVAPLKERLPSHRIFLSTTTATGHAVAERSVKGADGLFFAPFDWPSPVRKALDRVQPALLVLVETEIWPNLIHEAHRRGVRVVIVNGRISPRSFGRYRAVRGLLRQVLAEVDLFLMQSEPHADRARQIGAPPGRVRALGNLKYDALGDARTPAELRPLLGEVTDHRPLWVAGSTVAGEEPMVLAAFRDVRARVPGTRLLIAPRHPERFGEVAALIEAAGFRAERRSALGSAPWQGEVLLLDTLGELARVYALATVVFVGGSLVSAGGHNILEAAASGKPVIVGPHMENFQEIADEFQAQRAMRVVLSAEELGGEVAGLLADPAQRATLGDAARAIVDRNRGALARTVDALAELLRSPSPPGGGEGRVRGRV